MIYIIIYYLYYVFYHLFLFNFFAKRMYSAYILAKPNLNYSLARYPYKIFFNHKAINIIFENLEAFQTLIVHM